jgi:glycosyltransferase 2 family protein
VSAGKKIWSTAWRLAVGGVLLLWIVHSIFVNEARIQAKAGELLDRGKKIEFNEFQNLPRLEQWRLGWTYGPPAVWDCLRGVDPGMFALSLAFMGSTILIGIVRWRMVLRVQGFNLPFARAAEISLVAHFFNSFLLGTTGGDVMKAYYAARETHHKKTEAVLTVFVDRALGLWAMLLFACAMMLPNYTLLTELMKVPEGALAVLMVLGMTVAATVFMFLAFRGGVSKAWGGARHYLRKLPKGAWLERTLDSCRSFGRDRFFVTRTVSMSVLLNVGCVLQFLALSWGLNLRVQPMAYFLVVPIIVVIAAVPISPSGLGLRENLFVHLLGIAAIGVPATEALSLSLLSFGGSLFWSIIGGIVYLLFKHKHHLDEKELAESEEDSASPAKTQTT